MCDRLRVVLAITRGCAYVLTSGRRGVVMGYSEPSAEQPPLTKVRAIPIYDPEVNPIPPSDIFSWNPDKDFEEGRKKEDKKDDSIDSGLFDGLPKPTEEGQDKKV